MQGNPITRRAFIRATAAAAAALAVSPRALAQDDRKYNIVFILIDDLGAMDLGVAGSTYYETPHTDRLASQGMRFTTAYSACPVCSPTRASILTGRYPARLHLTTFIPGPAAGDTKLK